MTDEVKRGDGRQTLGRRRGLVVWKQIESILADELVAGRYPPGSKLPPEPELMARFNVGRHTLRQTMAELEAKGLVRIEQGRGTFVHDQVIHYRISERTRFTQNLKDQQIEADYRIVASETTIPSEDVRAALSLPQGQLVTKIVVDSYAGQLIIAVSDVYFSARQFPDVARVYAELKSTTDTYRSFGIQDYMRKTTRISSRPPTEEEARRLSQPASRPVLITRKVDVDLEQNPISYSETRWSSDRVELVVED